jgi:hypothetical protein
MFTIKPAVLPGRCGAVALALLAASVGAACGNEPVRPAPQDRSPTPVVASPAKGDLAALDIEFDSATDLTKLRWLHEVEGGADQVRRFDVGQTQAGSLTIEPWTSAWFEDFRGPMLFTTVTADVLVSARLQGLGLNAAVPHADYSFVGLALRAPQGPDSARSTGRSNWAFITSGTGRGGGIAQLETKTTQGSRSVLRLIASQPGWVDLAMARVGTTVVTMYRLSGQPWRVAERYERPDLPAELQVGIIVYTDWAGVGPLKADPVEHNMTVITKASPDLRAQVDHLHFWRPGHRQGAVPGWAADRSIDDAALAGMLAPPS